MGQSVSRLGDALTPEGCWSPTTIVSNTSSNVFTESVSTAYVGSVCAVHQCPPPNPAPHAPVIAVGSSTVFVNSNSIARVGDTANCGATIIQGASTVFSG